MKILYSQILELVPGLKKSEKEIADALTVTGVMVDKIEPVDFDGKKDFLIGLEVRQNRPDCLGVIGVAREVAAYFGKKMVLPKASLPKVARKLPVTVKAKEDVKRVVAIRLEGLANKETSPELKHYLELNGINSVNLIVDLSNWAMLYTGFPNHIFDADKVAGALVWERSPKNQQLTTLDGTILELKKDDHLVISDSVGPLVLASSVGGKRSAVTMDTKNIIIEVASYDAAKLLKDARSLGVVTEAGNRLQKHLATEPAAFALQLLVNELLKRAGGEVASQMFDYYPKQGKVKAISFKADLPSLYAGIPIAESKAVQVLVRLGFKAKLSRGVITATAPSHRTDIEDAADLLEEVTRIVGFDTIPINEPPALRPVTNVTPASVHLESRLKQVFANQGFDEVRTLPLTTSELNVLSNYGEWQEIRTQNSINEEYPVLRQSLASGLFEQEKTYLLKNVQHIQIFEAGKVFGKTGKQYLEREMFAALLQGKGSLGELKDNLLKLLAGLGFIDIRFLPRTEAVPAFTNPFANYDVVIGKTKVGVLYAFKPQKLTGNSNVTDTAFFELDLEGLVDASEKITSRAAGELADKLSVLDGNIIGTDRLILLEHIDEIKKKIGSKLWDLEVVDEYEKDGSIKLTLRASYLGVSESEAKKLHSKIFS